MAKASSPVPNRLAPARKRDAGAAQGSNNGDRPVMSASEAAQYIADFTAELATLARRARLDTLAYMLEMARLEASQAGEAE